MRPSSLLLTCTLALSLTGGGVRAQEKSHPSVLSQQDTLALPPPAPLRSLAQALAALEAPKHDLFLTVGADKVRLPPGAPPPDPDSRPGSVGAAYGRLIRDFGGVVALAPPDMVVLNTRPGVPDPFDGMPPEDALKLLLAGLTPPQWGALTGPSGLGLRDLSDDGQRSLFLAVLPSGDVRANPQFTGGALPPSVKLTPQDLAAARLRLGRRTRISLPFEGKPNSGFGSPPASIAGKALYTASSMDPNPARDTIYGAALRQVLPNIPKAADLDYDAAALKQSVGVDGIATVGDLVARVGQAAGLELYADRRYEKRSVTLVGRRTARGVDLLRATAFCVTGTFRKVGPAYVLTDDLQGTAPRRQRLTRFVQEAEMARHTALEAAGDNLVTGRGGLDALPPLDGLDLSAAQMATIQDQVYVPGTPVRVPFALLTPAQQEYAAAQVRQTNEMADQAGGHSDRLTLAGQITLQAEPFLFLQTPAVPGPVALIALNAHSFSLFQPSANLRREMDRRWMQGAARKSPPPASTPPALPPAPASLLAPYSRRAVFIAPRTASEVDQVVTDMKALGLNQLWLDVFSGGHSHLDIPKDGGPDILMEALARTRGTGIVVVPTVSLLQWGVDAPADALDRTALGETSAQQSAWESHYADVIMDLHVRPDDHTRPSDAWACPFAPSVEQTLLALVRRMAAMPSVTTLALRDTVPPGYYHATNYGIPESDLGYVPALRLTFLRRDHVDPLDLDTLSVLPGGEDVSLPELGGWSGTEDAFKDWNDVRDAAGRGLLRHLLAAAQEASGSRFRFLVPQRGEVEPGGWYGLWDDPRAPLPELPVIPPTSGPWVPLSEMDFSKVAHTQSRLALYALPAWVTRSLYLTADMLRKLKPGWDGVVLDTSGSRPVQSLTALAGGHDPHHPEADAVAPATQGKTRNAQGRKVRSGKVRRSRSGLPLAVADFVRRASASG